MEERELTESEKEELQSVATPEQIEEMKRQVREWSRRMKFGSRSPSSVKALEKKKKIRKQIKQKKARDRKRRK